MFDGLNVEYKKYQFLFFIRFYNSFGHYLFFVKLPFRYVYFSSFPTVCEKKFLFCDYKSYKNIIKKWSKNFKKPNMISFPESKDIRRKLFKDLVPKPNERKI